MENIKKPLSLGFIGGATDSAVGYVHFAASMLDKKFILESGCFSRDEKINKESAKIYGVPEDKLYSIWQEMVVNEKNNLDAVVILTPTPSHTEIVKSCLSAKIPVICEKALTTSSLEAQEIKNIRDNNKGFLAVTYNYSGYPMVRELRSMIKKGELGKILHFQAEMPQEGFIRIDANGNKPQPQTWRLSDGKIPTIYLDLAVHLHELIYYVTGEKPVSVIADQDSDGWFKNIIDNVSCLCRYTNNIQGHYWFSKSALGYRNGLKLRIFGAKASAEWFQMNPEELLISYVDGRRQILDRASSVNIANQQKYTRFKAGHPAGFIEAFANLYSDIAEALVYYKTNGIMQSNEVFSVELALEGLIMLEAMVESSHTKTWQQVKLNK
jgi:predicted dehydrogenase